MQGRSLPKFNVCNCADVVQLQKYLQMAKTQMRRRIARRIIRVCVFCRVKHILGNGGIIKSNMNQDLMSSKPLKGV